MRVVPAPVQAPDVLVGHARYHLEQFWVLAEEVLANEGAVVGLVVLILAVDRFLHDTKQSALEIASEQRIPVRAPNKLDDVPTRSAKIGFEFLDDLAVATHRTVEALHVAVHNENQVVKLFARRAADHAERYGF